jgi:hypothetical protein
VALLLGQHQLVSRQLTISLLVAVVAVEVKLAEAVVQVVYA